MADSPPSHLVDSSDTPVEISDTLPRISTALSHPLSQALSTPSSPTVIDQSREVTTPIHPTYHGVTRMPSSILIPSEIPENEDTCIAYIHFSSVGYCEFYQLISVLSISIPSREYIKTSDGEW